MNQKRKMTIAIMILSMFLLSYMAVTPIISSIYHTFSKASMSQIQMVVTLIPLSSVFTMFLCNSLTKRISMRNIGNLGLFIMLIGAIIPVIISNNLTMLYVSSILLGLGIGFINVISSTMISYYFTGKEKMKLMGYQSIFVSIGGALFSYVSGILANYHWSNSYICFFLALISMFILTIWVPNDTLPREEKKLEHHERLPLRLCWLGLISILFFISINVFNTSISMLVENLGYDTYISGIVTSLYTIIGIVAGLLLNKIVWLTKKQVLTFACFIATLGLFALSMSQNIVLLLIGALLVGFAFATRNPAGITISANMTSSSKSALAIAIFNGCGQFGCFLSPYVIQCFQPLFGTSIAKMFLIATVLMLATTLLHFCFNPVHEENLG